MLDGGGIDGGARNARGEEHQYDVFEIVSQTGDLITARSAYRFEVGEEFTVRFEGAETRYQAIARVRAHVGPVDDRLTELEISERSPR